MSYHILFTREDVVCVIRVESMELLVVSNSIEQVLRLRRCEARVATIGFTLFKLSGVDINSPMSGFSS